MRILSTCECLHISGGLDDDEMLDQALVIGGLTLAIAGAGFGFVIADGNFDATGAEKLTGMLLGAGTGLMVFPVGFKLYAAVNKIYESLGVVGKKPKA